LNVHDPPETAAARWWCRGATVIWGTGAAVVTGTVVETLVLGATTLGGAVVRVTAGAGAAVAGVVVADTGGTAVTPGGPTGVGWAIAGSGPESGDAAAPENAWAAATEHPTVRATPPSSPAPVSWLTRRSRRSLARIGFSVTRRFSPCLGEQWAR
jgi:hypothetical protein